MNYSSFILNLISQRTDKIKDSASRTFGMRCLLNFFKFRYLRARLSGCSLSCHACYFFSCSSVSSASRAMVTISLKVSCLSWEEVASPVIRLSETVRMVRA